MAILDRLTDPPRLADEEELFSCVMCGIPAEWTKEDLIGFVEPYSFDIEMMYMCNQQRSQAAVLCFEELVRGEGMRWHRDRSVVEPCRVVIACTRRAR
jgi:hypothetical protein